MPSFIDLTGRKFNKLTAISLHPKRSKQGKRRWICDCDCGKRVIVTGTDLTYGNTKSCGCIAINDLVGRRFGRLSVISLHPERGSTRQLRWVCLCDCGETSVVDGHSLVRGSTKSCGCGVREATAKRMKGMIGPKHPAWNPLLTEEERIIKRGYPEYKEWRQAVYERDSFTCQICGDKTSGNLAAHHIESYDINKELRTVLENGVTLCIDCHDNFHHIYGRGNNTREQFKKFVSAKLDKQ